MCSPQMMVGFSKLKHISTAIKFYMSFLESSRKLSLPGTTAHSVCHFKRRARQHL